MTNLVSHSLEETAKIAREWLASLTKQAGKNGTAESGATLVGLSGHLGAGKTAFVKAVAKELGVKEEVTSPTFVLMKLYDTKSKEFPRLVHIDAYRLERAEELGALNWEELMADKNNLILVEWPENVGIIAPQRLHFEIKDGAYHIGIYSGTMAS
jgi:tRNA threonylcarbamoyl adenosine modification protein YjeE